MCLYDHVCFWELKSTVGVEEDRRHIQSYVGSDRRAKLPPTNSYLMPIFCLCVRASAEYLWCQSVVGFHCSEAYGSTPLCWSWLSREEFWKRETNFGFRARHSTVSAPTAYTQWHSPTFKSTESLFICLSNFVTCSTLALAFFFLNNVFDWMKQIVDEVHGIIQILIWLILWVLI